MSAIDEKQLKKVQPQLDWLPKRMRELRDNAGFTQAQVGDAMGTNHRRVWDMETGRFDIKWSTICRWCLAVGVPINKLIEGCPRTYPDSIPAAARGEEFSFTMKILSKAKFDAAQWKEIEKLAKDKRLEIVG